jgi:hypothetical protein
VSSDVSSPLDSRTLAESIVLDRAGAIDPPSIFQSNNDPEMRFRFQYKMILKLEWA